MQLEIFIKIPSAICIVVSLVAMITDVRTGKIYNWLTMPSVLLGFILSFALAAFSGGVMAGFSGLGWSILGMFLGLVTMLPGGALGMVGMGDLKLMMAIGAIGGPAYVFCIFLYSSALGIIHALVVQFLNYGKDAPMMLITSFTTLAAFKKTVKKENEDTLKEAKYRFLMGIDIFAAVVIAYFYPLLIKF